MKKVLVVKNLVKSFGKIEAVKGVGFEVYENEIFALIGPNGAGKSTTLRMIATILKPTGGEILINDCNAVKSPDKARKLISYLPEEAGVYKNITGNNYLKLMADLYAENLSDAKKYFEKAVKLCNLGNRLKDKASTYSKGMARKLLLSRAVMVEPRLAILDEPTSGLDVVNAHEIRNIIKELSKSGMSVLLSSHNMLEIEFLADRVAIIAGGKIHDSGTASELKKKYRANNLEEVFIKSIK